MFDSFGYSVAIEGDRVFVGAPFESSPATGVNSPFTGDGSSSSGAVYVFVRNGTSWSQEAYIKASNSDPGDRFGSSLAAHGDTLIVGAWRERSNATGVDGDQFNNGAAESGAAYVFTRGPGGWSQQAYLKASNTGVFDAFGGQVALYGDLAVVGASGEDGSGAGVNGDQNDLLFEAGAAYVFERTGTSWSQIAYLKATHPGQSDDFGAAVGICDGFVAVAAICETRSSPGINGDQFNNSASNAGAVYTFRPCGADAGRPFCQGDGGDQLGCTDCPCGNNAAPGSAGGCLNTVARSAVLSATGATSSNRSACDLVLRVEDAMPSTFALLLSGSNTLPANPANPCVAQHPGSGVTSAALDGLRCVGGSVFRHGVRVTDALGAVGTTNAGWAGATILGGLPGSAAGQTRYFQSFYRDLGAGACTAGVQTTNGLAITL